LPQAFIFFLNLLELSGLTTIETRSLEMDAVVNAFLAYTIVRREAQAVLCAISSRRIVILLQTQLFLESICQAPSAPYLTKRMNDVLQNPIPANASQARQRIADLRAQLARRDIFFRDPPDEPTSCCGRGCNGCVWEGYLQAVGYWCEQVRALLHGE
jgi:hypothetical protein